jgi:hypothetical protein
MDVFGAIIAGMAGTVVISIILLMAPRMGMPEMDIVGMLGTMFNKEGSPTLGWIMHFMMGIIFAVIYAALWTAGIGAPTPLWGLIFGAVHWLFSGLMMGVVPMMHAGVRAGTVEAPGIFMSNSGGVMAFMGGLIGHMLYGLTVALVYSAFVS